MFFLTSGIRDDLLTSRIEYDRSHIFSDEVQVKMFYLEIFADASLILQFLYYRHRVSVVNNVCCLGFIFVLTCSPVIINFYRPSSVALLNSVGCFLNDVYVFESFLSVPHLVAI